MASSRLASSSKVWVSEEVNNIITKSAKDIECRSSAGDFSKKIHKDLLCHFSPYYDAMLNGDFVEKDQTSISLDLTADQAKLFVSWLYTGHCVIGRDYPNVFGLYVFADATINVALCRYIMTSLHRYADCFAPPIEPALDAYKKLPDTSGLVRWILDKFGRHYYMLSRPLDNGEDCLDFWDQVSYARMSSGCHTRCRDCNCATDICPCCENNKPNNCRCSLNWLYDKRRGCPCLYHEHETEEEWHGKEIFPHHQVQKYPYASNLIAAEGKIKARGDHLELVITLLSVPARKTMTAQAIVDSAPRT